MQNHDLSFLYVQRDWCQRSPPQCHSPLRSLVAYFEPTCPHRNTKDLLIHVTSLTVREVGVACFHHLLLSHVVAFRPVSKTPPAGSPTRVIRFTTIVLFRWAIRLCLCRRLCTVILGSFSACFAQDTQFDLAPMVLRCP